MSKPEIFRTPIPPETLRRLADESFGDMIKFVVDIKKGIISAGGGLHSDEEEQLLKEGSLQEDLWGGNYYPDLTGEDRIEYKSMINIRPKDGNTQQDIQSKSTRQHVRALAERFFGTSS